MLRPKKKILGQKHTPEGKTQMKVRMALAANYIGLKMCIAYTVKRLVSNGFQSR